MPLNSQQWRCMGSLCYVCSELATLWESLSSSDSCVCWTKWTMQLLNCKQMVYWKRSAKPNSSNKHRASQLGFQQIKNNMGRRWRGGSRANFIQVQEEASVQIWQVSGDVQSACWAELKEQRRDFLLPCARTESLGWPQASVGVESSWGLLASLPAWQDLLIGWPS